MSDYTVVIERGTTRAIIHVKPTDYYAPEIRTITHHKLTDYDFVRTRYGNRMVPTRKFLQVDYVRDRLYVPINALPMIVDQLGAYGVNVDIREEPIIQPRKISVRMIKSFTPRPEQVGVINFLTNEDIYRKGLATATGSGKTVSSIASLIKLGYCGVIIVSGLQDQWFRSIYQFTNAKEGQVYKIQGIDSIIGLMDGHLKPDIFVCSLETVRLWVQHKGNYEELPTWYAFLKHFGVGTKIMDEVHLNFHADTIIDLNSNVKNNIYLTATFSAASKITKKIFNMIYPPTMRYGEALRKRYIDVYVYAFRGSVSEKKCVKMKGYNHSRYELELLKRPTYLKAYFDEVIFPVVNIHYINRSKPGQKMLIYFARLEMVDYAYKWFRQHYPKYKVTKYVHGVADTVLASHDIIIATPRKAGCGTDIKNLKTVIQTVSCKADTVVDQSRGRLRELEEGDTPEYIEVVDWAIQSQVRHCKEREDLHRIRAKNYYFYHLPGGGSECIH